MAGQGLAEYALILSLIAILVVGVLMFLGTNVQTIISKIATTCGRPLTMIPIPAAAMAPA